MAAVADLSLEGLTLADSNPVPKLVSVVSTLKAGLKDKASKVAALNKVVAACEATGPHAEPFLIELLPQVLDLYSDKDKATRAAAEGAGKAIMALLCPNAFRVVLPMLFTAMQSSKWQTKVGALDLLAGCSTSAPAQVTLALPDIVPAVSECMGDTRNDVVDSASKCMSACCSVIDNKDIKDMIPAVISTIARPTEVPECVYQLASTTFVQTVEPPVLAIMVPLLQRGLRERVTAVKRLSAVITDNMCKMVEVPAYAKPFGPKLLPELEKVSEQVADPECRDRAKRAYQTLQRACGGDDTAKAEDEEKAVTFDDVKAAFVEQLGAPASKDDGALLDYAVAVALDLILRKHFDPANWEWVKPYIEAIAPKDKSDAAVAEVLKKFEVTVEAEAEEEDDEGEDLCDCEFTLGYGNKILLNTARLRLKKGRRYGLRGANGTGKSTLLRAIANNQVDGFPPPEQLRTCFVEHDITEEEAHLTVVEFVVGRIGHVLEQLGTPKEEVITTLESVGFDSYRQKQAVMMLSGGWKLKLALVRAMLTKADILLLDEPTNHLDVVNHAWLVNYLNSLGDVTVVVISDDMPFLDKVATDMILIENLKLRRYKGNLTTFFGVRPDLRPSGDVKEGKMKFKFPDPSPLVGVKGKDRAILKMKDVSFHYPNTERMILTGVSIFLTLNSRVAVLGPNGAGKSTMIKLLTGELEPDSGDVWKHPNMRYGYVAQHAFHHLEQHLDMTPNEYIQWRYQGGSDKEEVQKVNKIITPEEKAKMEKPIEIDGVKKIIDRLLARRQVKGSYEYEVSFRNRPMEENKWFRKDRLEELGFDKIIQQVDERELAAQYARPLSRTNVEKHLKDFGLDPEVALHARIRSLSGGQKVKVVMAGAMWPQPHILVLDEPTNYLDRDSLEALAAAIKVFEGGVVMVTHNFDFAGSLCSEEWVCAEGKLTPKGQPIEGATGEKLEWKPQEEITDALGNVIKVKQEKKKVLTRKEKKEAEKRRKFRIANGETVSDEEDE